MPEKDPAISKLINFFTVCKDNVLLVLSILFEAVIKLCELIIKGVTSLLLILLATYIFALCAGYATPPEWFNIPSFNLIVDILQHILMVCCCMPIVGIKSVRPAV